MYVHIATYVATVPLKDNFAFAHFQLQHTISKPIEQPSVVWANLRAPVPYA